MHYYQHNIGDYRRKTIHLSLLEHGVYRQLLDMYYLEDGNIPEETEEVCRRLCARTDEEKSAVKTVLNEFFTYDSGWKNSRCDKEISDFMEKADRARKNGKLGGRPPKTKVVISGNPEETQEKANLLTNKPINQVLNTLVPSPAGDDCPQQEILKLYAEHLPMLTQVKVWSEKRQKLLRTRWREDPKRQSLEWWGKFFRYVAGSDFLTGKSTEWQADLEWLLTAGNFVKVIEGKYENKEVV